MPNDRNILSPITIIGNGRSGTSLVSKIFSAHPDCFFAGETVNLIHSVWRSLESSLPRNRLSAIPEVIQRQFLHLFPSRQRYWMHKPIGIPIVARMFASDQEFYEWFWDVLDATFPQAQYFTVLRHPLDVLVSSDQWWDYGLPSIVESNRRVAELITHPRSKVGFALNYHELVADPEPHVRALFEFLNVQFHPSCLKPFEVGHVMNQRGVFAEKGQESVDLRARRETGFSHRDAWLKLDRSLLSREYQEAVDACWEKYGYDFGGWSLE